MLFLNGWFINLRVISKSENRLHVKKVACCYKCFLKCRCSIQASFGLDVFTQATTICFSILIKVKRVCGVIMEQTAKRIICNCRDCTDRHICGQTVVFDILGNITVISSSFTQLLSAMSTQSNK